MGMQPVLPITLTIKKIKGTARQCYSDGDGVVRCEWTFTCKFYRWVTLQTAQQVHKFIKQYLYWSMLDSFFYWKLFTETFHSNKVKLIFIIWTQWLISNILWFYALLRKINFSCKLYGHDDVIAFIHDAQRIKHLLVYLTTPIYFPDSY